MKTVAAENNPDLTIISAWMMAGVLILVGCGKAGSGATFASSCTVVGSGFTTCFDYSGADYTTESAQTACAGTTSGSNTGTYSSAACPTSG